MSLVEAPKVRQRGLKRLLMVCVPLNRLHKKTLQTAAHTLQVNRAAIYGWVFSGKIPPIRAIQLSLISEGRVPIEQFYPYLDFPDRPIHAFKNLVGDVDLGLHPGAMPDYLPSDVLEYADEIRTQLSKDADGFVDTDDLI